MGPVDIMKSAKGELDVSYPTTDCNVGDPCETKVHPRPELCFQNGCLPNARW